MSASVLTISSTGRATGQARGATSIETSADGRSFNNEGPVVPADTYRLSGAVRDAGVLLAGARVEVVPGAGPGLVTVTTAGGNYDVWGVAGDIEVRDTREGFQDQRKSLPCHEPSDP